ncbi:fimbria/pilus outer membrane usher protein [Collimonas sp. NPDC087041]|uniref:fimbria/pilus outer membrane usher protein n=1 Tax=Collimonas sp. NPDC087041 TaxID=3363960 RepID=UPI0037F41863
MMFFHVIAMHYSNSLINCQHARLVSMAAANSHAQNQARRIFQRRVISAAIFGIFAGMAPFGAAIAAVDGETPAITPATVKFDPSFFSSGPGQKVDMSRFDKENVVLPGSYRVDVIINEARLGRRDISFSSVPNQVSAMPCYDRAMLIQFGVDPAKLARGDGTRTPEEIAAHQLPDGPLCGDLGSWVPGATASFDAGEQSLTLTVPQLYMNQSARGYVDPSQWDNGINAALLGYNFSTSTATSGGGGTQSFLGLNGGINMGGWRLRHQGALGWSSTSGENPYQNTATYLQRGIPELKSQLIVGDSFSSGQIMESIRVRGVSLASDDRMTPQSQQGYAPVVRGIAEGNAKVSISQNGYKIYETTVPPGPFVIDDLYATGYGGDLKVTVTEADGRSNTFVVPFSALPQLLRQGSSKYSVIAGQLKQYGVDGSTPFVMQASAQHGFSNAFTGYAGFIASDGYTQVKMGSAISTPIGAFSADATTSRTAISGNPTSQGQSFGIAYNKNIPESGTNFSLGAYRFSTSGYLGLADAVNVRDLARRGQDTSQYARQKSRLDLNLSQTIGAGSMYLSGSSIDYWQGSGRQTSFSAGYSSTWNKISWSLSAQRSRTQAAPLTPQEQQQQQYDNIFFGSGRDTGRVENRIMLSMSIPLGSGSRSPTLTSSLAHNSGSQKSNDLQVGVNGTMGEARNINYGISSSLHRSENGDTNYFNANAGYQASATNLRAGYSQYGNIGQLSFSADGGVIAHADGVSFAQSLGDAVALVHVPEAEGAAIESAVGVRIDRRGYAVAPYLTPYQNNTISIDPKGTSDDVELKETTQTVAPTLGAVVLLKYASINGRAVVIKAAREDGTPLPFAAQVFDEKENAVGVVGQASKAFVRGIADSGVLTVKWGETADSQCRIRYQLPVKAKGQRSAELITGTCVNSEQAEHNEPDEKINSDSKTESSTAPASSDQDTKKGDMQ